MYFSGGIHLKGGKQYHIEVRVAHGDGRKWSFVMADLKNLIRYKFFGQPKNKRPDVKSSDFNRGKEYKFQIEEMYKKFGFDPKQVVRVWCSWIAPNDISLNWADSLSLEFGLKNENFHILSFRDEVLKSLSEEIGTSNYEDEIMRTLSLLKQRKYGINE